MPSKKSLAKLLSVKREIHRILKYEIGEPFIFWVKQPSINPVSSSRKSPLDLPQKQRSMVDTLGSLLLDCDGPIRTSPPVKGVRRFNSVMDMIFMEIHPAAKERNPPESDFTVSLWQREIQEDANRRIADHLSRGRRLPISMITAIKSILTPLNPIHHNKLGDLARNVSDLKGILPQEKEARLGLLQHLERIKLPPIDPIVKSQIKNDCHTAIVRIDRALMGLAHADRLLAPYVSAAWSRSEGKVNNPPAVTQAGKKLVALFVERYKLPVRRSSTAAAGILYKYDPSLGKLDDEGFDKLV